MNDPTNAQPGGLVEVSRSGGFAGMTMHGRVNLDRLSGTDLEQWRSALRDGFDPAATAGAGQPSPDRYVYRVRNRAIGLDVTVGEQDLPEHLRTLLDGAVRPPA